MFSGSRKMEATVALPWTIIFSLQPLSFFSAAALIPRLLWMLAVLLFRVKRVESGPGKDTEIRQSMVSRPWRLLPYYDLGTYVLMGISISGTRKK